MQNTFFTDSNNITDTVGSQTTNKFLISVKFNTLGEFLYLQIGTETVVAPLSAGKIHGPQKSCISPQLRCFC